MRVLSAVASALLLVVSLATPAAAQSLEVGKDAGLSIRRMDVSASVEEGVALVTVDQSFHNATRRQLEGTYRFQLPADAVICSFSMWMAGREKRGVVLEAKTARQVYESIVRKRIDPGLLEQDGWRSFKVSVFPIPANDDVRIRLSYAYSVPDDLGLQTLEIPLPEKAGAVGELRVRATIRGERPLGMVDCPRHEDATKLIDGGLATVDWSAKNHVPGGPFVIRSMPADDGLGLSVIAHREPGADGGIFVARIVPRLPQSTPLPRDVVFVIDRSGSMQGTKIEQAREALRYGLTTLRSGDRFGIVSFSSGVEMFGGSTLHPAEAETKEQASKFARHIEAGGGTNIDGALGAALGLHSGTPGRMFVVVFLTDGAPTAGVTDPDQIVARVRKAAAGSVRLFAFGVGDDVKDFLLSRLAREVRGAASYVRTDENLEVKLSSLFSKVRSPVLSAPEITVEGVEAYSIEPRPLPDVFQGEAVVMVGRYKTGGQATFRLRGNRGAEAVEVTLPVVLPTEPVARPHLAQLWARHKIDRLLDDLRVHGMVDEIKQDIIRLGVKHSIVTPYTSFLVVEDGVDLSQHVPDLGETAAVPDAGGSGAGSPGAGSPGGTRTPGTSLHGFGSGGGASSGGASSGGSSHGGSYRGPGSEVPPDSREPSDPPPRSSGGGPTTPGGEPATGGDIGGGPSGPSTGGGPSGPATGGAGAGRGRAARAPGYEHWRFWWTAQRSAVVDRRLEQRQAVLRRAGVGPGSELHRELDAALQQVAIPALRRAAAATKENFLVRSQSIRALARMGDPWVETYCHEVIGARNEEHPRHHRVVTEQAVLALGLLPNPTPESRALLLRVALDANERRAGLFVRSFAALALGLTPPSDQRGDEIEVLLDLIAHDHKNDSLPASAMAALGLMGDRRAVPELLAMVRTGRSPRPGATELNDVELSHAIAALTDILVLDRRASVADPDRQAEQDREVAEALLAVERKQAGTNVRRSLAIGLGRVFPLCDDAIKARVWRQIRDFASDDRDQTVRNTATIALAAVAADTRETASGKTQPTALSRSALSALEQEPRAFGAGMSVAPYRLLALGLAGSGEKRLREALADRPTADAQATAWLALALGGFDASEAYDVATSRGAHPDVIASGITALALSGDERAGAVVESVLDLEGGPRSGIIACGEAAAILRKRSLAPALLRRLRIEDSQAALYAIAVGLGESGSKGAVAELVAIIEDAQKMYPDLTRASAAIALGRMGRKPGSPLLGRLMANRNWRAHVPALWEAANAP